jgi:uncharacterized secreted protein with C-terminal beta-propeller domain
VARYYVNAIVQQNTLTYAQKQQQNTQGLASGLSSGLGASSSSGLVMDGASSNSGQSVNSFDTNNQEANVDEGDYVKSDGNTGTILTSTTFDSNGLINI